MRCVSQQGEDTGKEASNGWQNGNRTRRNSPRGTVINEMTIQMSSAVEQQSNVAEHINQQVTDIADSARTARDNANETSRSSERLQQTTDELHQLIQRFSSKH